MMSMYLSNQGPALVQGGHRTQLLPQLVSYGLYRVQDGQDVAGEQVVDMAGRVT